MGGGAPWLDQPVLLHSSRADKCKLSPEQCAFRDNRWRYWYVWVLLRWVDWYADFCGVCRYEADHVYALATVYFCCAVIGVFAISNLLVRYSPDWVKRTPVWRGFTSISRYLSYRGYSLPKVRYWTPSLGVILLGLIGAAFFLGTKLITLNLMSRSWLREIGLTLGSTPYYWPTDANYGSSPPIATRAGWMALALLPFVL